MKHLSIFYVALFSLMIANTALAERNAADYFNQGVAYFKEQNLDAAIDQFTTAIAHDPTMASAYFNLGIAYEKKNDPEKAAWCYEHALAKEPNDFDCALLLARTYKTMKKYDAAQATYETILQSQPNHLPALQGLIALFEEQKMADKALSLYEKAVRAHPTDVQLGFDYANALFKIDKPDSAIEQYNRLLQLRPNNPHIYCNLGHAYRSKGDMRAALACYQKAAPLLPTNPYIHYGLAESYLATGNYKEGFIEFEWRYKREPMLRKLGEKLWDGSDPAGKTFLVRCEYGQGDTIQFFRYVGLLKERGAARIILEAQDTLIPLLKLLPGIDEIIPVQEPVGYLPAHDYQIPLMSMPRYFATTVETVPAHVPYISASPELVNYWKNKLAHDTSFKIGICWKTSPYYESFKVPGARKSVPLAAFNALAQIPGVRLYSLQKMDGLDELQSLPAGMTIQTYDDFDASHGRFMDTAALICNLDLVISVDTSVAHIAGALGKPVFTLLPTIADWRWMSNRTDSPWYPTMTLFRQKTAGSWDTVIADVASAVKKTLEQKDAAKRKPTAISVTAEIPVGELVDKITILEIKKQQIKDPVKLRNIEAELASLNATYQANVTPSSSLESLTDELMMINNKLWVIEDSIREKERHQTFDQGFIDLARSVYFSNDKRCEIKRAINTVLGSRLLEEKSYTDYHKHA